MPTNDIRSVDGRTNNRCAVCWKNISLSKIKTELHRTRTHLKGEKLCTNAHTVMTNLCIGRKTIVGKHGTLHEIDIRGSGDQGLKI